MAEKTSAIERPPLELVGRSTLVFKWRPGDTLSVLEVANNAQALRAAGVYEQALIDAYRRPADSVVHLAVLMNLLRMGDKKRLRLAGDALPHAGSFVLFRGVVAASPATGPSWTSSRTIARIFALRNLDERGRPWPASTTRRVYRLTASAACVFAYVERPALEYIVDVPVAPELVEDGGRNSPGRVAAGRHRSRPSPISQKGEPMITASAGAVALPAGFDYHRDARGRRAVEQIV